jgi:hypothetical protein
VENAPEDIKPDPVAEADIEEEEVADEVLSPCGDLVAMEPSALMGRLTAEQIGCLQSEMTAGAQTKRDRVSRMLLLNTWGLGDMDAWWKLAENHLDQFAADAELTYLYAHYLGRKGQNRDAIYWAEKGLNLRRNWVGDRHVQRVDRLMRLKAICAAKIWGDRSESYTAKPTATTAETLWAARNEAKVFSREWLDHATASGLDNSEAKMLCASAAATSDYCQ